MSYEGLLVNLAENERAKVSISVEENGKTGIGRDEKGKNKHRVMRKKQWQKTER